MRKFTGNQRVEQGTYWNVADGSLVNLGIGGVLPGGGDATYLRIPLVLLFPLGAILGGLYVAFLPAITVAAAVAMLGKRVLGGAFHQARKNVSFGWRPTEAYLAGRKRGKNGQVSGKNGGKEGSRN